MERAHRFACCANQTWQDIRTERNGRTVLRRREHLVSICVAEPSLCKLPKAGAWTADLLANRAAFNSKTSPATQFGKYTLLIPGAENSLNTPGGDGFGAVTVDLSGNINFKGTLGDGTKVSQKAFLSKQGQWPFYSSTYSGKGLILGWLTFTNQSSDDISGLVNWTKLAQPSAKFYPGGFATEIEAMGSKYAFTSGVPILSFSTGRASFVNGNLTQNFTNQISFSANNKVINLSSNKLTLTLTTSSGLFKGSVVNPFRSTARCFKSRISAQAISSAQVKAVEFCWNNPEFKQFSAVPNCFADDSDSSFLTSEKINVPVRPCGQTGTKMGMGVRHALFPVLTLGAKLAASFPTPFSTASGVVLGLIAGPSSALQPLNFE